MQQRISCSLGMSIFSGAYFLALILDSAVLLLFTASLFKPPILSLPVDVRWIFSPAAANSNSFVDHM